MPGYPMGGYAAGGKISRGVWTRLYVRAIAMEDEAGSALAMVSCDLWSIPGGLADRVAELVATEYGASRLGREQIILAATHTHNSPGNYSSSTPYNTLASIKPGFDRDLFNFLAHRIAFAIAAAWDDRRPATLIRNEAVVGGIGRNRSLAAFLANGPPAQELLEANRELPIFRTPFPAGGDRAYRAIDPTLTVIRAMPIEPDSGEQPIALMVFHAVHPTAMGPTTEVYSSDLFGVAAETLERENSPAIVAFFNGAEGDVSANWKRQDRPSTLELGLRLADGVRDLLAKPGRDVTGKIQFQFMSVNLDDLSRPVSGASQMAGSEGDWTFFRSAGWREGLREERVERRFKGHGPKMNPMVAELLGSSSPIDPSRILAASATLPKKADAGVYRIGGMVLATLPGEFTTMLGLRIRETVAEAASAQGRVLLVGLANEYLSYFTTEAEYELQHYEGASMLYGPDSAGRFEQSLAELAGHLEKPRIRTTERGYRHEPGPACSFGVSEFGIFRHMDRLGDSYYKLANVLMDEQTSIPSPDHPFMAWTETSPEWPASGLDTARTIPEVWVERANGERVQSDTGLNIVTTVVATFSKTARWNSVWLVPGGMAGEEKYRLAARGTSGQVFKTKPFTITEAAENWGFVSFGIPVETRSEQGATP